MCENTKASDHARWRNWTFNISVGVLQGDILAPYLFVIVLDYTLREAIKVREEELGFQLAKRQSKEIGPEVLTYLDFTWWPRPSCQRK